MTAKLPPEFTYEDSYLETQIMGSITLRPPHNITTYANTATHPNRATEVRFRASFTHQTDNGQQTAMIRIIHPQPGRLELGFDDSTLVLGINNPISDTDNILIPWPLPQNPSADILSAWPLGWDNLVAILIAIENKLGERVLTTERTNNFGETEKVEHRYKPVIVTSLLEAVAAKPLVGPTMPTEA